MIHHAVGFEQAYDRRSGLPPPINLRSLFDRGESSPME